MCGAEHASAIARAVFPGLQGGPHNHTTAAIAVALEEALQPEFADYARQTVANAKALAEGLVERGFDLVSGGTDNHLILMDLTSKDVPGKVAAQPLDPSGIRLGTPAVTTRGMTEAEMALIAGWIDQGVEAAKREDEQTLARIADEVRELAAAFPIPGVA